MWLPLQAAALPLLTLHCAMEDLSAASADAAPPCHGHEAVGDDAPPPGNEPDATAASPHSCCTHFSALPTTHVGAQVEPALLESPAPTLPQYAFFPEQNDRPPRT